MSNEMLLNRCHREFVVGELVGKFSRVSMIVLEEFKEEPLHLGVRCVLKFDLLISSTRAEESRVQFVLVVRSHDQDTPIHGFDSIKSVEEA